MKNKIVLAVGAHPDDMDFSSSGTIAKWVLEGATAYYLILTRGCRGSNDPKMTSEKLSKIRQREQEEAAKILGVRKVFFLNHTDTELVADLSLKEEIVRFIRKLRPNIVITMDPTFYYVPYLSFYGYGFVNHSDHRAAGLATLDACFPLARDRLSFLQHEKQGLKPHKVEELLLVNLAKADFIVDITKTFAKKLQALACHKSQYDDFKMIEDRVRKRAAELGKKNYKYAENFTRIKLP
ncbi:MAG: PIG-L family deacetylase [Candidatus Levybacteria bacterium]|nr:PIG-L family deacetylase [Candidatus Levybacteria bacterium]MBI3092805.1 PIG-L family deacetylase [Candidatus Levybacteria bacterium]